MMSPSYHHCPPPPQATHERLLSMTRSPPEPYMAVRSPAGRELGEMPPPSLQPHANLRSLAWQLHLTSYLRHVSSVNRMQSSEDLNTFNSQSNSPLSSMTSPNPHIIFILSYLIREINRFNNIIFCL